MCKAMEDMRDETEFKTRLALVRKMVQQLGWTEERALEFCEISKAEYLKYLPLFAR